MNVLRCPLNNYEDCKKSYCAWYMTDSQDCAIPVIAVLMAKPPKEG